MKHWLTVTVIGITLSTLVFAIRDVIAAPLRQIPLTARLATADFANAVDGTYSVRFAIYSVDRTTSDPFPSDGDSASRVWTETKSVTVARGFFRTMLGDTTALPTTLDFNTGSYYLAVRIGTDPEMTPRFKIGAAPFAINSTLLQGLEPGNSANNLLKLNASAGIDITGAVKTSGGLDLQNSQAKNFRVENVAADPTASTSTTGRLFYNTTDGLLKFDTGTVIQPVGGNLQQVTDLGSTTTRSITTGGLTTSGTNSIVAGGQIRVGQFSSAPTALGTGATYYDSTTNTLYFWNGSAWRSTDAGGITVSLQAAYDSGNTITTSNARDIDIVLANTATDSNLDIQIATDSTSTVSIARAAGTGTASPIQLLLIEDLDADLTIANGLTIQTAGTLTDAIDLSDATGITNAINLGGNKILGTSSAIDLTEFDVSGTTGAITIDDNGNAGNISIEGTILDINSLDFVGAGSITTAGANALTLQPSAGQNLNITLSTTGDLAVNTNQLYVDTSAASVGVGTTTPTATVHVVGQCVTGDTKLRRRRRRKKKDGTYEDDWEEVPITRLKVGDEILSLDEQTGSFVWKKVRGLLDMGVQTVYRLITQSGFSIETTANHPYLAIEKQRSKIKLTQSTIFEVDQSPRLEMLSKDSIIALANRDQSFTIKLAKSAKREIYGLYSKERQLKLFAPEVFALLIVESIVQSKFVISRLVIDREYQGYEGKISEIIKNFYPKLVVEFRSLGRRVSPAHRAAYAVYTNKKAGSRPARLSKETWLQAGFTPGRTRKIPQPHYPVFGSLYKGQLNLSSVGAKWQKVAYLKAGMRIATVAGWQTISAIYPTGRKAVYDLEIDATHNFVANDIVAHNTYINSSATTGIALDVDANSLTTGSGIDISSTSTAGTGSGNSKSLNIARSGANANATHTAYGLYGAVTNTGTTSTNIAGYLSASGATNNYGLIVENGSVGIGTTGPGAPLTIVAEAPSNSFGHVQVTSIAGGSEENTGFTATSLDNANAFLQLRTTTAGAGRPAIILNDYGTANSAVITLERTTSKILNGTRNDLIFTVPSGNSFLFGIAGSEVFRINSSGNVGIGTTAPTSILALGGDAARTVQLEARTTNAAGSALSVVAGAAGAGATGFAGGQLNVTGGAAAGTTGAAAGGDVRIAGGAGINTGAAGNVILNATAGNVGIGTTSFGSSAATVLALGQATGPSTSPADVIQLYVTDVAAGDARLRARVEGGGISTFPNATGTIALLDGGQTFTSAVWNGTAITDTYVADTLTTDTLSAIQWAGLTGYPTACSAGSAVSTLADTPTCTSFNTDTSIRLQDAYDATSGNSITTTDARDIDIVLADTTTDSNLDIQIATASTSTVSIARAAGVGTANPAQLLLIEDLDADLTIANGLTIQTAGTLTDAIDLSDATGITNAINLGGNKILGTSSAIDFTEFDVSGTTGAITIDDGGNAGNISIESTVLDINSLDFTGAGSITTAGANALTLQPSSGQNLNITLATTGDLAVNTNQLYVDTSAASVGIGTASPTGLLTLASNSELLFHLTEASADAAGDDIYARKSRGTVAAPTIVVSGDILLRLGGWGHDGSDYREAANIRFEVDGTPGASDMPGRISFWTTPDGSASRLERMRVDNAGLFGIGTTTPASLLHAHNTSTITIGAGASISTATIQGTFTEAASGNHARIAGLELTPPTITAGVATVTDTATLYIANAPTATVSGANYALWVDDGNVRFDGTGNTVGTITSGTWNGTAITDTYVADTLTTDTLSAIQWAGLTGYPTACSAGSAVSTLADTPTCTSFNTDTSIRLQDAYDATSGNSITTTDARDIDIVLADTTTDSNLDIQIATASTSTVSIARAAGVGTANPAQLLLIEDLDADLTIANGLTIQTAGTLTDAIDLSDATGITNAINLGANRITGTTYTIVGTTSTIDFTNFDLASTGDITQAPSARSSGSPVLYTLTGPAHTALAADTEASDVNLNLARTVQFTAGAGTFTNQRAVLIQAPTYSATAAETVTNAASLAITGAPVQGTNMTLTNAYALWTQAGDVRLDQGASDNLIIDAAVTDKTSTAGAIDLDLDSSTTSVSGIDVNVENVSTATTGTVTVSGLSISPVQSATGAGGTHEVVGAYVQAATATGVLAGTQNQYGVRIANQGVASTETAYGLYVDSQSGSATANYAAIFAGGNVGIGTTTPSGTLNLLASNTELNIDRVVDNANSSDLSLRKARGTSITSPTAVQNNDSLGYFGYRGYNGSSYPVFAAIEAQVDAVPGVSDNPSRLMFWTTADGGSAPSERMRITSGGNFQLGLGVTSGTLQADIGGTGTGNAVCHSGAAGDTNDISIVDCTSAPSQDYAEMYPVVGDWEYGEVMMMVGELIRDTTDGIPAPQVIRATTTYSPTVIGVLSNNYGDFTSAGHHIKAKDNPRPVALSGRVPVKVTTHNGADPIRRGDLLTASEIPGVAMKYEPAKVPSATLRVGIIGMALEDFTLSPQSTVHSPQQEGTVMMMVRNFVIEKPAAQLAQATSSVIASEAKQSLGDCHVAGTPRNDKGNACNDTLELGQAVVRGLLTVVGNAEFQGRVDLKGQLVASTVQVADLTVSNAIKAKDIEVAQAKVTEKLFVNDIEVAGVIKGNDSIRGSSVIKAGESEVIVKTAKVSAASKVYLTIASGDFAAVKVKEVKPGESFTMVAKEPVSQDTEVNWLVVE